MTPIPYECHNCGHVAQFTQIDIARGMTYVCPKCEVSTELKLDMEPRAESTLEVDCGDILEYQCYSCSRDMDIGEHFVWLNDDIPICEDCLLGAVIEISKRKRGIDDEEQPV